MVPTAELRHWYLSYLLLLEVLLVKAAQLALLPVGGVFHSVPSWILFPKILKNVSNIMTSQKLLKLY